MVLLQGCASGISKVLKLNGNSATGKIHKMFLTQIRQIKEHAVNLPKLIDHEKLHYKALMWARIDYIFLYCFLPLSFNLELYTHDETNITKEYNKYFKLPSKCFKFLSNVEDCMSKQS